MTHPPSEHVPGPVSPANGPRGAAGGTNTPNTSGPQACTPGEGPGWAPQVWREDFSPCGGWDPGTPGPELVPLEELYPAHWHVDVADHHAQPEHDSGITLWGPDCPHARPQGWFTDPEAMARTVFMHLAASMFRRPITVRMTRTHPGDTFHDIGTPLFVDFDGDDTRYQKLFIQSLTSAVLICRYVQFDVILDPIRNQPNTAIRISAVPGDDTRCPLFSCNPHTRYTDPDDTPESGDPGNSGNSGDSGGNSEGTGTGAAGNNHHGGDA